MRPVVLFPQVKWPSSAELKNEGSYTASPPWCGQGQLYFYLMRNCKQVLGEEFYITAKTVMRQKSTHTRHN